MSLPRLAVNPAVEAWKSTHLGKPGAFLSTAFQAPARAGAAVTKPLWDRAEQKATTKPTSSEVEDFRKGMLQNPNYQKTAPVRAAAAPPVVKPPVVAPVRK